MSRSTLLMPLVGALLLAMLIGCQDRATTTATTAPTDAAAPQELPPVEPPPPCQLKEETTERPGGKVIALYHTSNVVGELDPCG